MSDVPSAPQPTRAADTAELTTELYQQLLAMARARMSGERTAHTLQPTALVNEAYLRLQKEGRFDLTNRPLFFHAAAEAMRRILIEHARSRQRQKRGGGAKAIPINLIDLAADDDTGTILILDDAICRLKEQAPQQAEVVRLRFYAGLSVQETAEAMGVSEVTVKRAWRFARAWLWRHMKDTELPGNTPDVGASSGG
ncbi:MAG: ECF-type sigma factor [Phycisphaerae bacterium]|nr:ECF-type sigma factor [Phycisphaerae bacterium]MDW8262633.1 ECF-type sigma factor [Phycisphaerales bacterium]